MQDDYHYTMFNHMFHEKDEPPYWNVYYQDEKGNPKRIKNALAIRCELHVKRNSHKWVTTATRKWFVKPYTGEDIEVAEIVILENTNEDKLYSLDDYLTELVDYYDQ